MAEKIQNSYRSIFKSTSVFGGVEVLRVLMNLVRGKFISSLLGPEGMGVAAIFGSTLSAMQQMTVFGTDMAIVKEIGTESAVDKKLILSSARRLMLCLAVVGCVLCAAFSTWLSLFSFGSDEFGWQFVMLGLALAFGVLASGDRAILQGFHDVKRLSRSSLVGAASGLCIGVPFYWLWGCSGIVPAILVASILSYLFYRIALRGIEKQESANCSIGRADRLIVIKRLVSCGSVVVLSGAMVSLVAYLFNVVIRSNGTIEDVGLYQAASSVTNQCVGMVFSAMSLDYFPRLMRTMDDGVEMNLLISRQTEIASMVLSLLSIAVILFAPMIIRILFTDDFLTIVPLLCWMAFGSVVKGVGYPLGYVAFAKNNRKVFILMECVGANMLDFTCMCVGYLMWGLAGIGIGFCMACIATFVMYCLVNYRLYNVRFDRGVVRPIICAVIFAGAALALSIFTSGIFAYVGEASILALASLFVWKRLRNRVF